MAHAPTSETRNILNIFRFLTVFTALSALIWTCAQTLRSLDRVASLQSGSIDALAHAEFLNQKDDVAYPAEWVQTARLVAAGDPANTTLAIKLLEAALNEAPSDARSWALLAFLRKKSDGNFSPNVEQDLQRSFLACPYCSKSLLRWRLTFVLDNWRETSEETRISAFSGADFLRWWHLDYDYLEQVRVEALARGIPFDQYRRKIDTPARPNEIGLNDD